MLGSFVLLSFEAMNLVWSKELVALTWDDEDFDVQKDESWAPEKEESRNNTHGNRTPEGSAIGGSDKKNSLSQQSAEKKVRSSGDLGENNA